MCKKKIHSNASLFTFCGRVVEVSDVEVVEGDLCDVPVGVPAGVEGEGAEQRALGGEERGRAGAGGGRRGHLQVVRVVHTPVERAVTHWGGREALIVQSRPKVRVSLERKQSFFNSVLFLTANI